PRERMDARDERAVSGTATREEDLVGAGAEAIDRTHDAVRGEVCEGRLHVHRAVVGRKPLLQPREAEELAAGAFRRRLVQERLAGAARATVFACSSPRTQPAGLGTASWRVLPAAAQRPSSSKRAPMCCRAQPSSSTLPGPQSNPSVRP